MCGRITRGREEFDEGEHFQLRIVEIPQWNISHNAAPGQRHPVILENHARAHQLVSMRWGLEQRQAPPGDPAPINARAETVATLPRFSTLLPSRRCIVPATGWYEWRREGSRGQPYFARPTDQEVFGFAGLYSAWRDETGSIQSSFCIITTRPTSGLAPLYDRMPVVLWPEDEAIWLSKDVMEIGMVLPLLKPYVRAPIEWWPVSRRLNDPNANTPDLSAPCLNGAELRGTLPREFPGNLSPTQISLFG